MRGDRPGDDRSGQSDAAFGKVIPQFLQCAIHPFLGRAFLQSQGVTHLPQSLVLKISQHDGISVRVAQLVHRLVHERREIVPIGIGWRFEKC